MTGKYRFIYLCFDTCRNGILLLKLFWPTVRKKKINMPDNAGDNLKGPHQEKVVDLENTKRSELPRVGE